MKRKHIDACREARLWIRDIVVPIVGFVTLYTANPQTREWVDGVVDSAKRKVKSIFKKGDS